MHVTSLLFRCTTKCEVKRYCQSRCMDRNFGMEVKYVLKFKSVTFGYTVTRILLFEKGSSKKQT